MGQRSRSETVKEGAQIPTEKREVEGRGRSFGRDVFSVRSDRRWSKYRVIEVMSVEVDLCRDVGLLVNAREREMCRCGSLLRTKHAGREGGWIATEVASGAFHEGREVLNRLDNAAG